MQKLAATLHCGPGRTVNVYGPAWHTVVGDYLRHDEWPDGGNGRPYRIVPGHHFGGRKYVDGFELLRGRGYVMRVATAHRRYDLEKWCQYRGIPFERDDARRGFVQR